MEKRKPKQLYSKLFWTYTVIVLCIVAALSIYFISVSRKRILESNMEAMERISESASDYIEETARIADYIHEDLYRSKSELEDLLAYFHLEPEVYQRYYLDRYSAANELVYEGIHNFVTEAFEAYSELKKIDLVGYKDFRMTECYPEKIFYPGKDGRSRIYGIRGDRYERSGKLIYVREVRNPDNMKMEGYMIFTFDGKNQFEKIQEINEFTELVVTSADDKVIFQDARETKWEILKQEDRYFEHKELAANYVVYTFLNRSEANKLTWPSFLAILCVGVLSVVLGIICIEYYVRRLTQRVDAILGAMNQVTTGNLQVRLDVANTSDELDMVAANFNNMCEELELYIRKSYLAEIERKNAQMQALQSQINPHFLYNTLEAIRMKAICNGDREVGKMLYSMVVLFRSQLKEADVITIGQELDYCKQYMELFEYRYQGSFESLVECEPELLPLPIIKFVLQPIIENYFIHGIERDRKDNRVHIWAERNGEALCLYVEDNGCGMEAEEIEEKNKELKENLPDEEGKKAIGIINVNRRIKAVYGEDYGIYIEAVKPKGLRVRVTIKVE